MIIYREQRTKTNNDFSSWEEVLFGVSQGSVLGPILFNTFLSDLSLIMKETEFTSYVDDNTLYDAGNTIEDVISYLQKSSEKLYTNSFPIIMKCKEIQENVIRS